MMFYVFLVLLAIKGIDAQLYQWHCSALDPGSNRFSLPDLETEDDDQTVHQRAIDYQVEASPVGMSYIYPVPSAQVTCRGTVKSIRYCYTWKTDPSKQDKIIVRYIFTLSLLSQNGTTFRVLDTTDVFTAPTNSKYTKGQGSISYDCCKIKDLIEMKQFQLPSSNFAFGITIPSFAVYILLEFSPSHFERFIVEHYRANIILTKGTFMLGSENRVVDRALQIIKFHIEPNHDGPTEKGSNVPGTKNGSMEIFTPAVPGPGLSTTIIAGIAAVVVSSLLIITLLFIAGITVAVVKIRKLSNDVGNTPATEDNGIDFHGSAVQDDPVYETISNFRIGSNEAHSVVPDSFLIGSNECYAARSVVPASNDPNSDDYYVT